MKIAGGHRMAQDEESLGGAIVKFRTSLDAAETCHRGLTELRDDGSLPNEIVDELLPDFAHVIEMLEAEIASMRSRTWWDQPDK